MEQVIINGKAFDMGTQQKRKRIAREERKVEILIACEVLKRGGKAATVHSVAKRMRYSASTLLREMMNELVQIGVLTRFEGEHWNGKPRFTYVPDMDRVRADHPVAYGIVIARLGEQRRMF